MQLAQLLGLGVDPAAARRSSAAGFALVLLTALGVGAGCATTRAAPTPAAKHHAVRHAPRVADGGDTKAAPPSETTDGTAPAPDAPPPDAEPEAPAEEGMASFYADSLAGNRTASGERYRPDDKTCAHRTHKFGTKLVVTNVDNGKQSVCRVNDRGPYVQGRVVDVSKKVAGELGMIKRGVIRVRVERAAEGAGT
jgi:rare lipoprotein A